MTITNFITIHLKNGEKIYGNNAKSMLVVFNDMYSDNDCFKPMSVNQLNNIINNHSNKYDKLIENAEKIPMLEYFKSQLTEFKNDDSKYTESYNKKRYANKIRELYAVEIYKLNCKLMTTNS